MGTTIVKQTRNYLKTASPEVQKRVEEALAGTNFGGKIKLLGVGFSGDSVCVQTKKQTARLYIGPLTELIVAGENPTVEELNRLKASHTYPDFRKNVGDLIQGKYKNRLTG